MRHKWMLFLSAVTLLTLMIAPAGTVQASTVIHYVKWNASGLNNGTSWANAYTDLQSALAAASSGDEIWVAAGTYKPTTGTDRTASFTLKNGVAIYGGFAGTETARTQHNPVTNVTILSGEIGAAGVEDNSYHVVNGGGTNDTAILDGFTITGGNANDLDIITPPPNEGGGIYNENSSPRLMNLIFSNNSAGSGGGMYNRNSHPQLNNVTFLKNVVNFYGQGGGGMFNTGSNPVLTNVRFEENSVNHRLR